MPDDDAFRSPETLLRHAAAADAAHVAALLRRVDTTRFLDLVITQADLASDEDRQRLAGIDAVGDLARAAVEIMDLPQGTEFEDEDDLSTPTVTGFELVTVSPDELSAATLALPVSPWMLALVAFRDDLGGEVPVRRVVGAAADGRLAGAELRLATDEDTEILRAIVTREASDLGDDAELAEALVAALRSAARGA